MRSRHHLRPSIPRTPDTVKGCVASAVAAALTSGPSAASSASNGSPP
jgi:hypothetical protein